MEQNEHKQRKDGAGFSQKTAENRDSDCVHIAGVTGSNPVPPTTQPPEIITNLETGAQSATGSDVPDHAWSETPHVAWRTRQLRQAGLT